ncbi:hypothetical protein Tco_0940949 [Tanacetum coccineum]|uniref:Uncharacterized protein n=1 Tax=Tanacetum coccineum TaxID=301880 RepID=A0ABQ5DVG8_9ASTR
MVTFIQTEIERASQDQQEETLDLKMEQMTDEACEHLLRNSSSQGKVKKWQKSLLSLSMLLLVISIAVNLRLLNHIRKLRYSLEADGEPSLLHKMKFQQPHHHSTLHHKSTYPTISHPDLYHPFKLPISKKGEYDIWAMKMEHYLAHTDYPIWEVIQNGNGPVDQSYRLHQDRLRFSIRLMIAKKEMWDGMPIKSRFGGNDESKKMQKYILKQQFEGFSVSNTEGFHKVDEYDLEEMDLKWQWHASHENEKVFTRRHGHFARECRIKETSRQQEEGCMEFRALVSVARTGQMEVSKALVKLMERRFVTAEGNAGYTTHPDRFNASGPGKLNLAGKSMKGFEIEGILQSRLLDVYNLGKPKSVEEYCTSPFREQTNVAGRGVNKKLTKMQLKTAEKRDVPREEEQVFMDELERLKRQEKEANEDS